MDPDLNLLLNYPLISSEISNGRKYYSGIIRIDQNDIEIQILDKSKKGKTKFSLKTDFGSEIKQRAREIRAENIFDYLNQIVDILQTKYRRQTEINYKNLTNIYRKIIYEYLEFTRFHINIKSSILAKDLSKIEIWTIDNGNREHKFEISIDFESSNEIFVPTNIDLPLEIQQKSIKKSGSLTGIYDQFLAVLENLQEFWDILDEIDRNCSVIDPIEPSRQYCYRRIWITDNMSIVVTVDPSNPRSRPDLKFLGPERIVNKYRMKLNEKLGNWDDSGGILNGILEILGMDSFPHRSDVIDLDILANSGECNICFSLHLNGKIPEIVCENRSCENFYHVECLYEWLVAVNSKRIFNQIHGQCPNCEKGISCPIIDLKT